MGKRNTVGGKKGKGMANKALNTNNNGPLRLSTHPSEKYACVTKINGNGMCNVTTSDGLTLLGHIRGNMRGSSKRNNFISPFSIVLIGLREWESTPTNCDILCLYSSHDVSALATIPNIYIDSILHLNPLDRSHRYDLSLDFIDFSNLSPDNDLTDLSII